MFKRINATVLFVHNLEPCLRFYRDTLDFKLTFSDGASHAFKLEDQDFVLLTVDAAADMISAAAVGLEPVQGQRVLLCAGVDDVDAVYQALTAKGVTFIKPPKDQVWGRRTAYFADPEGHLWELYQMLD